MPFAFLLLLLLSWALLCALLAVFVDESEVGLVRLSLRPWSISITMESSAFASWMRQKAWRRSSSYSYSYSEVGPFIAFVLMCSSVIYMLFTLFRSFLFLLSSSSSSPSMGFVPILPGITMPWSEMLYLQLSVLIAASVHELGHAFCAEGRGVSVERIGVSIVVFVPMAFVELSSGELQHKSRWDNICIFSAGILQNIALCFVTLLLIFSLPTLLLPLYDRVDGAVITYISPLSPLYANLSSAVITGVNGKAVKTPNELITRLEIISAGPSGLCVADRSIEAALELNGKQCCVDELEAASGICLVYANTSSTAFCLLSRSSLPPVSEYAACAGAGECGRAQSCVSVRDPQQHILYVARRSDVSDAALFIGGPRSLLASIELGSLYPRSPLLPLRLPLVLQKLLRFVLSVSLSLALLNAAPVKAFDGESILSNAIGPSAAAPVLAVGTSLLLLNVSFSLFQLIIASSI